MFSASSLNKLNNAVDLLPNLTFPETQHGKPRGLQPDCVACVARLGTANFPRPIHRVARRRNVVAWAPVPKTTVYKYGNFLPQEADIGGGPRNWAMNAVSQSCVPQRAPQGQLRLRVSAVNCSHDRTALFRR